MIETRPAPRRADAHRPPEVILARAAEATSRLAGAVRRTPLSRSGPLGAALGCEVLLKQENLQVTGSCKARSALTTLSRLTPDERAKGIVTASTGNNGIATAWALERIGAHGSVFVPQNTASFKSERIRQSSRVRLVLRGDDIIESEVHARRFATRTGARYCSPYNEWGAIDGQATIAIELLEQAVELGVRPTHIVVPIGGGGLVAGIAGYLRAIGMPARIIGAQPARSAVMARSVAAGRILDLDSEPTLSDATAGGIEADAITFDLCRELVDEFVTVDEGAIAEAMRLVHREHDICVEGAGALSIAALLKCGPALSGACVVCILCGSNIDPVLFDDVLSGGAGG